MVSNQVLSTYSSVVLTLRFPSMPLSYNGHNQQGSYTADVDDGRKVAGHYNATCYVDVKSVSGAPNTDISAWMNIPHSGFDTVGKIKV